MKNSFELDSTIKIFNVIFNQVPYEVQMEYSAHVSHGMIKDIFRMDEQDFEFSEELLDYINENL